MTVFLLPKSFSRIEKEYKVKLSPEFLKKCAGLLAKDDQKGVFELLAELGCKYNLKGRKLGSFMYDCLETMLFLKEIAETALEVSENGDKA